MRALNAILALSVVPSLAVAQLDSVQVGLASLRLGMSEAHVAEAAGPELILQKATDRVPPGAVYREAHGVHAALVPASGVGQPAAWLTFEDSRLTRVSRPVADFEGEEAKRLVAALTAVLAQLGTASSAPVTVQTTSWQEGANVFQAMEFRVGAKQIVVTSGSGLVSIIETLGRGDIPTIYVGP